MEGNSCLLANSFQLSAISAITGSGVPSQAVNTVIPAKAGIQAAVA